MLFTLAARQRLLPMPTAHLLVLAVTLSMMLGPLLLIGYEAVRQALAARRRSAPMTPSRSANSPVIIAGFGRFGQIVSRVLRVKGIAFTALDSSQTHVDFVRRFGNEVFYGDASRLDLLRAAGAQSVRAVPGAGDR